MLRYKLSSIAALCILAPLLFSCGRTDSAKQNNQAGENHNAEHLLNFYNWADFIAPDTIASFEKLTAIKVHASYFDSNETLEVRMLTGNSGFDVVVASGPYFQRQIRSGAYLTLDKRQLPNLKYLDPAIASRAALYDPGNAHGVVYTWGTFGVGYNKKMVGAALPNMPIDSWRPIFDPAVAARLAPCGILMLDAPAAVTQLVLKYLGRDPHAPSPKDLADVEHVLMTIRPYIRMIDSTIGTEAMTNGDICIALIYNSDMAFARMRAEEANKGVKINFVIPKEGSIIWFDLLAIPRDAPHVDSAHLFINYLMNPQVIADVTNYLRNANGNAASTPLLDQSTLADTIIYPTSEQQQRLFVQLEDTPEQVRAITRIWQKFKTGQ
jgi:putrescine transport system substrate-binding protein